jgi:hypothetical protein
MSPPNGPTNGSVGSADQPNQPPPTLALGMNAGQFSPGQIKEFVTALEVPFDPVVIEWRVTNTTKVNGRLRGQVIPYADQRAYTDRLNALFSPAGWTRKYAVHTSANFQRANDQKTTAKVFVTCDLTIFGVGSHSATGEEWVDDENAGCAAEAQAFKRAAACFGLGRYLYYFSGTWVDLDDKKRPKTRPQLAAWATPRGWRDGLRPSQAVMNEDSRDRSSGAATKVIQNDGERTPLVREIENMQKILGPSLYRGLLRVARAWKPEQIQDVSTQGKTLERMQAAERGLRRVEAAVVQVSAIRLAGILKSIKVRDIDRIDNLETLHKLVTELEAAAGGRD